MEKIVIYTDGGSRGNPGVSGAGACIMDGVSGEELACASEFLGNRTNNFAEYAAVLLGLKKAKMLFGKKTKDMEVEVRMDSELVKKQLSGEYQIKEETLFPYFIKIWNIKITDFPNIKFVHIAREKNKRADELANDAMDGASA